MKFIRIALLFVFSFFVSLVLIKTFSMSEFRVTAGAWFFNVTTPKFPIYFYLILSFLIGLGIGLTVAVYNFFSLKKESGKDKKRIKYLDKEIANLNDEIDSLKKDVENNSDSEAAEKDVDSKDARFEPHGTSSNTEINKDSELATKQEEDADSSNGSLDKNDFGSFME